MTTAIMEIVDDDAAPFFAPVSSDVIDGLLGQYQQYRKHIDHIAGIATGEMGAVLSYFLDGNADGARLMPTADILFAPAGAITKLNSVYWSKALALTDVYDAMPQERRDEWNAQLRGEKTARIGGREKQMPALPDFDEATVRSTLDDLLAMRSKFFAERVDGLFRGLSGDHITNCPSGFNRRMIINRVTNEYGHADGSRAGLINDLRAVIAKFMGRDAPGWNATGPIINLARRDHGEWKIVDGGALRIRCYKIGTAHLEVHPDMAYRLNQVLAGLHPRAIPAQFRTKPAKRHKEFQMMGRPLPFAVLQIIREMRRARGTNNYSFGYSVEGCELARNEAIRVLESIGGVYDKKYFSFSFDFDPADAMDEIIASGCIPDRVAHQFYPTPTVIARAAVELAEIGPDDTVLEPSAGHGGIAEHFPNQGRTICVEISKLHCDILRAKGFVTVQADFIAWAATAPKFDRVVMNPPFADGRALSHLVAAAGLLKPLGRIVAVLPASNKGKDVLPGWVVTWSDVFANEFAGTSSAVVIMTAERAA